MPREGPFKGLGNLGPKANAAKGGPGLRVFRVWSPGCMQLGFNWYGLNFMRQGLRVGV